MNKIKKISGKLRVAWIIPSMELGSYWHPLFSEFTKLFKKTVVYTGLFSGYVPGFENSFKVEIVGKTRHLFESRRGDGYSSYYMLLSPGILIHMFRFRPDVIFSNGFSFWTMLAAILKPLGKWRVIIAYEGSSPTVDYKGSLFRTLFRKLMVRLSDALITNSSGGRKYLIEYLKAKENRVFDRPYEVPDVGTLLRNRESDIKGMEDLPRPVFLYVGQIIQRKGLEYLIEACARLKDSGIEKYSLVIVGDGPQSEELKKFSTEKGLDHNIKWLGWQGYVKLGAFFGNSDIFVLPSLEDTWGMVTLEAMAFGKPVLCSKWAGTAEMVKDGENGYIFDPRDVNGLYRIMSRFINDPGLITSMGQISKQLITPHNPEAAAKFLGEVIDFVLNIQKG